jgi:aminopeptidase N
MTTQNPQVNYLKDYKKPDFTINKTELFFEILEDKIIVRNILHITKLNTNATKLVLNGEDLKTKEVKLDGEVLTTNIYDITPNTLTIHTNKNIFTVETLVEINPFTNTTLMGIYKTNTCIASQCEPEGFRRITWFLDRPDVMALWEVSITAKVADYPILLSNGNMVKSTIQGDTHTLTFVDILPKPCYLFAFVAGDFDSVKSVFTTKSGRKVDLAVYVEKGKQDQAPFALQSLEKSMKWDEEAFNLEYELDVFSIVAVSDFNFGAMENKSLNIFNEALVLANPKIATDDDYFNIEAVVAHEYFHNFTGDRITCRDWFQLTLKEGLTVYRDQRFSADMHDANITRINDVEFMRNIQFAEDAGPLAHPIRPISYIEMNNFYTATVYDKGSEVIRMIETIVGKKTFKEGIAVYFEKFDGMAVTCEDFIHSMEVASGYDFTQFKNWYLQPGTPKVEVKESYNEEEKTYTITLTQSNNKLASGYDKALDLVMPFKTKLFYKNGDEVIASVNGNKEAVQNILVLSKKEQNFTFSDIKEQPVLSINRSFSAPVLLDMNIDKENLQTLITYETDGVIRFSSLQTYLVKAMVEVVDTIATSNTIDEAFIEKTLEIYRPLLDGYQNSLHLTALFLKLPSLVHFEKEYKTHFPLEAIVKTIKAFEQSLVKLYYNDLKNIFSSLRDNENDFNKLQMGIRSLKNIALYYIVKNNTQQDLDLVSNYYKSATAMTNKIAALVALKGLPESAEHKEIFASFYNEFKDYPTVLNKWFMLSASVDTPNIVEKLNELTALPTFSFSNPNKVRNLVGGFTSNALQYHNLDASGYNYLKDLIIKLDGINASLSAGLAKGLAKKNIHISKRKELIENIINEMLEKENISKGLLEILTAIKNS